VKLISRTLLVALAALTASSTALAQTDRPGSKDFPGISRMPNSYIQTYLYAKFDAYDFPVAATHGPVKKEHVEGEKYFIRYNVKEGFERTSPLQEIRNYENATKAAGGQVMWDAVSGGHDAQATLKLHKDSSEIWVYLSAFTGQCELNIVVKQAMAQEVAIDASAMASSIAASGSVAIYGINFDTASSVIKPDSEPAIDEISKLLSNNPALKVGIIGHTDMVGDATSNMRLSQARAQSVITDLVSKHGIAAARLVALGAGPWAPLASNKTEEGRAKNRRVELVEIATK